MGIKSIERYYKIGEVSEITGVPAHILRYWEKEFSFLRPKRSDKSHRKYRLKDIQKINLVKRLLYQEGLTISGVKNALAKFDAKKIEGGLQLSSSELKMLLDQLKNELVALRDLLKRPL